MNKTREEMIDALVYDWIVTIQNEGAESMDDTLRNGFSGYNNLSDDRLFKEYHELQVREEAT